jgi:hypothetical protein
VTSPRGRVVEHLAGAALAIAAIASLPLGARACSGGSELSLVVPGDAPYLVRDSPHVAPHVDVSPNALLSRVEKTAVGDPSAPGLSWERWHLVYGARWERDVVYPVLTGPFDADGTTYPCGLALRIGAGVLDTRASARSLRTELDRQVRDQFPFDVLDIHFPEVKSTDLRFGLEKDKVRAWVDVVLEDETKFAIALAVALDDTNGKLFVHRQGIVDVQWTGPTRDKAADHKAVNLLLGIVGTNAGEIADDAAQGEVSRIVDDVVSSLQDGIEEAMSAWVPYPERAKDKVAFRIGEKPKVTEQAITLSLCPRVTIGAPRFDSRIEGPPRIAAKRPTFDDVHDAGATIDLALDADALSEIGYFLWQTGQMQSWQVEERIVAEQGDRVRDLALQLHPFAFPLPPALVAEQGELSARIASVDIGTLGPQRVVAHAGVTLSFEALPGALRILGTLQDLRMDCTSAGAAPHTLLIEPCLSDLAPALRDELADQHFELARLERAHSYDAGGVRLVLEGVEAATRGAEVRVRAKAAFGASQ